MYVHSEIFFYQQFDFVKANSSRQEFLTDIVFMLFEKLSIELMSSLLVKQSCKTQKVVLLISFWLPHLSKSGSILSVGVLFSF